LMEGIDMMGIDGKVAVVTGGDSDLGIACGVALARQGASVVLSGSDGAGLKQGEKIIKEAGERVAVFEGRLSDPGIAGRLMEFASSAFGTPGILVNVPGPVGESSIGDVDDEGLSAGFAGDLRRYFLCCREAVRAMIPSGGGSIVNVVSIGGLRGCPGSPVHSTAMGGIEALSRQLSVEYAGGGIRVNCVVPGIIKTSFYRELRARSEPEFEKKLLRHIPQGRIGSPGEVASAVLFLSGDEASYITGVTIPVDGGYTAV